MASYKVCMLVFMSSVSNPYRAIRIGLVLKKRRQELIKRFLSEGFTDERVIGAGTTPKYKLKKGSLIHVEILGNFKERETVGDKAEYLLPVKKSGVWRDYLVLPADGSNLVNVIFRRDSDTGSFLHSIHLSLQDQSLDVEHAAVPSPGGRSLQVRAVDVGTQTELHVAYAEATYMLRSPGDSFKRSMPINMRREVAKVSPSPSGSFSIRLEEVNEETHADTQCNEDDNNQAQDQTKAAYEKLLSKQRLLSLVEQLAPAESFRLTLGLGVPDVKKKQEEHQEKNVVTVYFNLLVYWLEKMMGNKKEEAFGKLFKELQEVRKDLAEEFQQEFDDACKVLA